MLISSWSLIVEMVSGAVAVFRISHVRCAYQHRLQFECIQIIDLLSICLNTHTVVAVQALAFVIKLKKIKENTIDVCFMPKY